MALVRWEPFREIEIIRRQIDELFDELAGESHQSETTWMPAVELQDKDDRLILRVQLPGVEAKDVDIRVSRDEVYIAGEHRYQDKEDGYLRTEFLYGKFQRTISLPLPIQHEHVEAEFKNGILTLTLPKVEEMQRRVVRINLGENENRALGEGAQHTLDTKSEEVHS